MSLDDVYTRSALARRRLLRVIDHEWKTVDDILGEHFPGENLCDGDGVAVMIAINELGREGIIEFDPTWRVRLAPKR